jgi:ATP-binding cassette subfamily B protein
VAHRLTTAARADRIVVLSDGRIVEDGSHQQLLADGGGYARLWRSYIDGASANGSTSNRPALNGSVPNGSVHPSAIDGLVDVPGTVPAGGAVVAD